MDRIPAGCLYRGQRRLSRFSFSARLPTLASHFDGWFAAYIHDQETAESRTFMSPGERIHHLNNKPPSAGPVVYWMSRDQRCADNWALLYAQGRAMEAKSSLIVVFCLVPEFLGATFRQYGFMIRGLEETSNKLTGKNIGFELIEGDPLREIPRFVRSIGAGLLVTDFDPIRVKTGWRTSVAVEVKVETVEVDAHNIIPCRVSSPKQEYGAYTFRPKIAGMLDFFLLPFPPLKRHPFGDYASREPVDWKGAAGRLKVDRRVGEVDWIIPGERAGRAALRKFLKDGLENYGEDRNDPSRNGQSGLSPWLHFGQLSAQRVALEVQASGIGPEAKAAFMEELIVRRELSDNFCFYNSNYDSMEGFPDWARKSLDSHRSDPRPFIYTQNQLENALTHDQPWNAAQRQMVRTGKMHGYMRMYWAKKILEWSPSPEEALETSIRLNDRYELDGRDPNGYTGIAWSIGGVHDRAWVERRVFGKIRYMNEVGLNRKFDIDSYVAAFSG